MQTPRFCGDAFRARTLLRTTSGLRGLRINWLIVGISFPMRPVFETKHRKGLRSGPADAGVPRSEEHTSELQSLMRISYAVFCLKKKKKKNSHNSQLYLTLSTITTNRQTT